MGRPRTLSTEERARRDDACKRRWLVENYEYNRLQKRVLAARPEYLARRRQLRLERLGAAATAQASGARLVAPIAVCSEADEMHVL